MRLVKDVNDIRSLLKRTVANLPLYDISNENTPAQLLANQNDYVPGNFDVLRLASDQARTITGFRGGVKGRFLRLLNVGLYEITISHRSGSSALGNRVRSATGFDIILNSGGELVLYYDISTSEWMSSYASNADRISVSLRRANNQSIGNAVVPYEYITWETIVKDTGGFFDPAIPTVITIPQTGWYSMRFSVIWEVNNVGERELTWDTVGVGASQLPVAGTTTQMNIYDTAEYFLKGKVIGCQVYQDSGGPLNVEPVSGNWTTFVVTKI